MSDYHMDWEKWTNEASPDPLPTQFRVTLKIQGKLTKKIVTAETWEQAVVEATRKIPRHYDAELLGAKELPAKLP